MKPENDEVVQLDQKDVHLDIDRDEARYSEWVHKAVRKKVFLKKAEQAIADLFGLLVQRNCPDALKKYAVWGAKPALGAVMQYLEAEYGHEFESHHPDTPRLKALEESLEESMHNLRDQARELEALEESMHNLRDQARELEDRLGIHHQVMPGMTH